jgi:hypothetical protein
MRPAGPDIRFTVLGASIKRYGGRRAADPFVVHDAIIPIWQPTSIVALVAGMFWLPQRARRRAAARMRRGCCGGCGYDLRAGHARCPECGAETGRVC